MIDVRDRRDTSLYQTVNRTHTAQRHRRISSAAEVIFVLTPRRVVTTALMRLLNTLTHSLTHSPLPPKHFTLSIDKDSFLGELKSTRLITDSLNSLLICYDIALSALLDKHAPIVTKLLERKFTHNPWFGALHAFISTVRHAENLYGNASTLHGLVFFPTSP